MSSKMKHSMIVGLALFALFFGSGNLIFPPAIGNVSGSNWWIALIGFSLSGIVLPLMAVIAVLNVGGKFEHLMRPLGKPFYHVFTFLLMVVMGMFISTPRMAATTHELGVAPIFPEVPLVVTVVLFFAISFYFVMDKSNVIDLLGKILTPFLVFVLLIIVVRAFMNPLGEATAPRVDNAFSNALITAYQTGDATSGILCATIFIMGIIGYGYKGKKEVRSIALNGIFIAGIGLFVIYGGLMYLGSSGSGMYPADMENTALVVQLINAILGQSGGILMAIAIGLGCLTSAIGVIAVLANYLNDLTKNKIGYRLWAFIICIVASYMGTSGVTSIINYAAPIFNIIYPVIIVLVLLGTFNHFVPNDGAFRCTVYVTQAVSLIETFGNLGYKVPVLYDIVVSMPFTSQGMAWIIPAIVGFIVGWIIFNLRKGNPTERASLEELTIE